MINQFSYLGRTIKVIEWNEVDRPKYRAVVNGLLYFSADTPELAAEKATEYLDHTTRREKSTQVSKPYTLVRP